MMYEEFNAWHEVMEGCYGKVIGRCQKGTFLELDNGQEAFAYKFVSLFPGTEVLCTVLKQAVDNKKMLVSIGLI